MLEAKIDLILISGYLTSNRERTMFNTKQIIFFIIMKEKKMNKDKVQKCIKILLFENFVNQLLYKKRDKVL